MKNLVNLDERRWIGNDESPWMAIFAFLFVDGILRSAQDDRGPRTMKWVMKDLSAPKPTRGGELVGFYPS